MLKKLRLKLTLLYLLAAVLLAGMVGGGTYSLISYYFQSTTDDALRVKIGLEFAALDIPLPIDLYNAVRKAGLVVTLPDEENKEDFDAVSGQKNEGLQETELADIYVFPLSATGTLAEGYSTKVIPSRISSDAVEQALIHGNNLRTVKFEDGTSARILTYLVPGDYPVKVFQAGKYLTLQKIVLHELMNTMIILGAIVTLIIGLAAWFLAGRTLGPTQQAWEKQQAFVANASHELRAPLTLIHAGVEVALRESQSDSQKQVLSDVLSDSNYMNKLIEELLLLSRLDGQAVEFEIQPINLRQFLPKIIRQLEVTAANNGIGLKSDVDALSILADPMRLEQILLIVVDNAIQHTPNGGEISISVRASGKNALIAISDTGTGIGNEHLHRVFDRFYQVRQKAQRNARSSGLGLSIAKELMDAQKGSINIRNIHPHGTAVELSFLIYKQT